MTDELSLDPENWDAMRALGHRMVDEMMTSLETVRERPIWQSVSEAAREGLDQPLPRGPEGAAKAYDDFVRHVLPYPMGNIHPRFWGWVIGTGTPLGALAEMLAATMNPNVGGGDHGATWVEAQVLAWCREMLGYPADSSGLLVSGGSMANLVGLAVARNATAGFDVRKEGVAGASGRLMVYGSVEIHSSIQKAVELLGLGSDSLRLIPVNDAFEIDVAALEAAIAADRGAGHRPICIVGSAATVNTGAFDDLDALAEIARREGMWYHVDGAFGALAALDPDLRPRLRGMERADSLAFDLHKWMYIPYEAGCILVRDAEAHRNAFTLTPGYLVRAARGLSAGEVWASEYGIQLSRGFKALKIWMSIKEHGIDRYGALVRQNVEQAQYLEALVRGTPALELLAPVPLNIVCFRYRGDGTHTEPQLDAMTAELLVRLQEEAVAIPSLTSVRGRKAIRVAITNHRTRREDLDLLVREAVRIGGQLEGAGIGSLAEAGGAPATH
ncbi:MAG TPA: aminotransferase class V-fold PLP-dependent enzyme [Gemmatimonadales bacterium]|nr:aminotransferase class V-fold PLP-dependent enzyme [Gemmatimonadales bacterium]